jgi:GAF domain-containing protein
MLEGGHKLAVGGNSMVGWACAHQQARIALDVGQEAIRFANPLLPETRSEITLPLRANEHVLGALDIQSVQARAFDDNDITTLQGIADQIAMSLENARLFQQAQISLKEVERVNQLLTQQGWETFLNTEPTDFAEFHQADAAPFLPEEVERLALAEGQTDRTGVVCVPLTVHDQVIGTLIVEQAADQPGGLKATSESDAWIDLLRPVANQAAQAMESARLFEESQSRAQRERIAAQVTARMRETLDVDRVLQIAVREFGEMLGAAEVKIRLTAGDRPSTAQD